MRNLPKVTPREREVLHLIAQEYSTREIADKLYVSYETANTHRKNLLKKMEVKNTAGLVRVGFQSGLLRIAMLFLCMVYLHQGVSQTIGLQVEPQHHVLFGDSLAGAGSKLIWIPTKAALRAGELIDNATALSESWNIDSIGLRSTAFGYNNKVKGTVGMSWGEENTVVDQFGTA